MALDTSPSVEPSLENLTWSRAIDDYVSHVGRTHRSDYRRSISSNLKPARDLFGERRVLDVSQEEIDGLIGRLVDQGRPSTAKALPAALSRVIRLATGEEVPVAQRARSDGSRRKPRIAAPRQPATLEECAFVVAACRSKVFSATTAAAIEACMLSGVSPVTVVAARVGCVVDGTWTTEGGRRLLVTRRLAELLSPPGRAAGAPSFPATGAQHETAPMHYQTVRIAVRHLSGGTQLVSARTAMRQILIDSGHSSEDLGILFQGGVDDGRGAPQAVLDGILHALRNWETILDGEIRARFSGTDFRAVRETTSKSRSLASGHVGRTQADGPTSPS